MGDDNDFDTTSEAISTSGSQQQQQLFSSWDRRSVLKAVKRNGWDLEHASSELRKDEEVVATACRSAGGGALRFASEELRGNRDIVLLACSIPPYNALRFASMELRDDSDVVLHAITKPKSELAGLTIQWASHNVQSTKEIVMVACRKNGLALQFVSEKMKLDRDVVLAACKSNGVAIQYASTGLRGAMDVALVAIRQNSLSLEYVSDELKQNRELISEACCHRKRNGLAIQFASDNLRADKDIIIKVCSHQGLALQYSSDVLRQDKDVVLAAVRQNPEALKYALGGLNQNQTCLIAAGIWDQGYNDGMLLPSTKEDHEAFLSISAALSRSAAKAALSRPAAKATLARSAHKKSGAKIVLSTRFSLDAESTSVATQFTVELKKHPYIQEWNFVVYSPNAFNKNTCDPDWTNIDWLCRGTTDSCQMKDASLRRGPPRDGCCWRYSFRCQLEEAAREGGFMIQLVEYDEQQGEHILGNGQQIESEMARDTGTKVFRVYQPGGKLVGFGDSSEFGHNDVDKIISCVQDWYDYEGRQDMSVCEIHFEGSFRRRNRPSLRGGTSKKNKKKTNKNNETKQRRKKWTPRHL